MIISRAQAQLQHDCCHEERLDWGSKYRTFGRVGGIVGAGGGAGTARVSSPSVRAVSRHPCELARGLHQAIQRRGTSINMETLSRKLGKREWLIWWIERSRWHR